MGIIRHYESLCPNSIMPISITETGTNAATSCPAHVNMSHTASRWPQYGDYGGYRVRCNLIILRTLKDNSIYRTNINRANPHPLHNFTALPCYPYQILFFFPFQERSIGLWCQLVLLGLIVNCSISGQIPRKF
jgi:hypothetical protein